MRKIDPHFHQMTLFDVDRIAVRYNGTSRCIAIEFYGTNAELPTSVISAWRNSGDGPPALTVDRELIVEGDNASA